MDKLGRVKIGQSENYLIHYILDVDGLKFAFVN